ncbi:hypothetical protein [Streptomyces sp. YS415]|uniref:hypothetical protein n=1 Tax=Streptomyces sp. YS415 TaxID=2944806 RepID=UPI0020200DFB|nr:hypothetical protein [Streptomyces sp. YS415]MCL7424873.1 hypothetical protein [Streptomyces sp. YS415]
MLLTYIAEIADEPLILDPADPDVECETNTWWLGAEPDGRRSLSVAEVVGAFERTAERIRLRIREMDFRGEATFYVWHDVQAGQLRCSTASVAAGELPFGGAYAPSDDLESLIQGFLSDQEPGLVLWEALETVEDHSQPTAPEPDAVPFPVWVRSVGTV